MSSAGEDADREAFRSIGEAVARFADTMETTLIVAAKVREDMDRIRRQQDEADWWEIANDLEDDYIASRGWLEEAP